MSHHLTVFFIALCRADGIRLPFNQPRRSRPSSFFQAALSAGSTIARTDESRSHPSQKVFLYLGQKFFSTCDIEMLADVADVSPADVRDRDPHRNSKITWNGSNYLMAEERLTLGVPLIIFDVRTMVWSFNGQGMLGIKGESVLFQCH